MSEAEAAPPVEAPVTETVTESNEPSTEAVAEATTEETLQAEAPAEETAQEAPRVFKVKVDGEEMEVTEDELLKGYSRGTAANKRFEAAAKQRKQVEAILESIKDPTQLPYVLQKLGVDPSQVYQTWRQEVDAWESMSEEDRAKASFEQERAQFLAERQRFEQARKQQELTAQAEKYQQEFVKSFGAALEEASLPNNPRTLAMMAQYAEASIDAGKELSPKELTELVAEEINGYRKSSLEGLTIDQLEELVGKDVLNQLRKADVERVQAKQRTVQGSKAVSRPKKSERDRRLISSPDELTAWLNGE